MKGENGIPKDTAVRLKERYLNPLANSPTETDYEERKQRLLESEEWKGHPRLQRYMMQTWLSEEIPMVSESNVRLWIAFSIIYNRVSMLGLLLSSYEANDLGGVARSGLYHSIIVSPVVLQISHDAIS